MINLQNGKSRKGEGFTLVELLVVISIIALLLSVLMPSLQKARKSASRLVCATRIRELSRFNELYAMDNKGKLPPQMVDTTINSSWSSVLTPYVTNDKSLTTSGGSVFIYKGKEGATANLYGRKSVLSCPTSVGLTTRPGIITPSYARNFYLYEAGEIANIWVAAPRLFKSSKPSSTIFLTDSWLVSYAKYAVGYTYQSITTIQRMKATHDKKINFSWLDGHVTSEIKKVYEVERPEWLFVEKDFPR